MRHTMRSLAVLLTIMLASAASVRAQDHVGIRAGISGDPDQFFVGGHVESGPLARQLTFRPNVEVGVGDDVLVAINLEFVHSVALDRHPWRVYFGGGPAALIGSGSGNGRNDDDDVGGGFNLLVGAQRRTGLFGELKVGLVDSPEVKVTVGYAFR
jgi:hypothetical protein